MELWESAVRMVSALAIVLGLMTGLLFIARKVMAGRGITGTQRNPVQVVATGYLGARKTISLVSVAGEYLIVGATANDLVPLGRIEDSERVRRLLQPGRVQAAPETANSSCHE